MNLEIETELGYISAGVSRLEGLYVKLAQKQGITYGIVQVLYSLRLNGSVTQKEISGTCEIPKQTVNCAIKQLKADKYITLVTGKEDKRVKKIKLTKSGESYMQTILKPYFEVNIAVGNRVGVDLIKNLSKGLKTLGDALELEMELKEVSSKWEEKKNNEPKRR